jgi:hypothetical protein
MSRARNVATVLPGLIRFQDLDRAVGALGYTMQLPPRIVT